MNVKKLTLLLVLIQVILSITSFGRPAAPISEISWPTHVQDFPVLSADRTGQVWMAVIERPIPRRFIGVYRIDGNTPEEICTLEPSGLTGIGPPSIAGTDNGCIVAFAAEQNDKWRIGYAFIEASSSDTPVCKYIDCEGNANLSPSIVVVGNRTYIAWESNAGDTRSVCAAWVEADRAGPIQRISDPEANSYNPSIAATENGKIYVAWDCFFDKQANIYVAQYHDGKWQRGQQLTADPRIERHPSLATYGNQVWMVWQAQSYDGISINSLREQRVVVARVDNGNLLAPKGMSEDVLNYEGLLMRPEIIFDPEGRLWLTARESLGRLEGWRPLVWCFSGEECSGPQSLYEDQGRWRPVTIAWSEAGGLAAVQTDNLPIRWNQQGIWPDWRSGIALLTLPRDLAPIAASLETEALKMPATEFSFANKMDLVSTFLPRQQVNHSNQILTLFWGDLHAHTDISVCNRATNPPGHDLFANRRDIERLDFTALTDHGYNYDPPQWQFNGERTRVNHDPGRFLTFLAEEWTSDHISYNPPVNFQTTNPERTKDKHRYGHHNLIFRDPYYPRFFDSRDADITPQQVWEQFAPEDIVVIPHQLADWGNGPTDWFFNDERFQPVAEIFQGRGSYEYLGAPRQARRSMTEPGHYLQDAWAKGIVIGVIASPDHGGGAGKAGVWAEELTRDGIIQAIRARHTFGTSGAKMALFVKSGEAIMGDRVKHPQGSININVTATSMRDIKELIIFRNNKPVYRLEPGKKEIELDWTDTQSTDAETLWYYVRFQAIDDELAWSSPIWFER